MTKQLASGAHLAQMPVNLMHCKKQTRLGPTGLWGNRAHTVITTSDLT